MKNCFHSFSKIKILLPDTSRYIISDISLSYTSRPPLYILWAFSHELYPKCSPYQGTVLTWSPVHLHPGRQIYGGGVLIVWCDQGISIVFEDQLSLASLRQTKINTHLFVRHRMKLLSKFDKVDSFLHEMIFDRFYDKKWLLHRPRVTDRDVKKSIRRYKKRCWRNPIFVNWFQEDVSFLDLVRSYKQFELKFLSDRSCLAKNPAAMFHPVPFYYFVKTVHCLSLIIPQTYKSSMPARNFSWRWYSLSLLIWLFEK